MDNINWCRTALWYNVTLCVHVILVLFDSIDCCGATLGYTCNIKCIFGIRDNMGQCGATLWYNVTLVLNVVLVDSMTAVELHCTFK